MKTRVFHITDSYGLVEMVQAVSERAARRAWKKYQTDLQVRWGLTPREIVSIVDPVERAIELAKSNQN